MTLLCLLAIILAACMGFIVFFAIKTYRLSGLFKDAQTAFEQKQYDQAKQLFLRIISTDDNNEPAFVYLADIAEFNHNPPEALAYRYRAWQLNQMNREYQRQYMNALLMNRNYPVIVAELKKKPAENLSGEETMMLLMAGYYQDGIDLWSNTAENSPGIIEAEEWGQLASAVFFAGEQTFGETLQKLQNLCKNTANPHIRLEAMLAMATIRGNIGEVKEAENILRQAQQQNYFAATPALGDLFWNNNDFTNAIEVYSEYNDRFFSPPVVIKLVDLYAISGQKEKLVAMRENLHRQTSRSMIETGYYLDAAIAFLDKDYAAVYNYMRTLRPVIRTPFSMLMAIYADIDANDLALAIQDYRTFLSMPPFADFQQRIFSLLQEYLLHNFEQNNDSANLLQLALMLQDSAPPEHDYRIDTIVLMEKLKNNSLSSLEMSDAIKKFPGNAEVLMIVAEFFYKQENYEQLLNTIAALKQHNRISRELSLMEIAALNKLGAEERCANAFKTLIETYPDEENITLFWRFINQYQRKEDLSFLEQWCNRKNLATDFIPFCQAEIMLANGNTEEALNLLDNAQTGNSDLLFQAGLRLAENGRTESAIAKYHAMDENNPLYIFALLNLSEIYAENNMPEKAMAMAEEAWRKQPELNSAKLCLARRLTENNNPERVLEIIQLPAYKSTTSEEMLSLWVKAMERSIVTEFNDKRFSSAQTKCNHLLIYQPENQLALEYLQRIATLNSQPAQCTGPAGYEN